MGKFEIQPLFEASRERIQNAFSIYQSEIDIFHFSGHAGRYAIQTQEQGNESVITFAKGLADFIGMQNGVKLVFLNGCSTKEQVKHFHEAGIPVVIATQRPVPDRFAREFAERFYQFLAREHPIQMAFKEAKAAMEMKYGENANHAENSRSLAIEDMEEENGFIYQLHIAAGKQGEAEQNLVNWNRKAPDEDLMGDHQGPKSQDLCLLCDRSLQTDQFEETLSGQLSVHTVQKPHVYFIHGKESELPHSLALRFHKFSINDVLTMEGLPISEDKYLYRKIALPDKEQLTGKSGESECKS